jgi:hypothetical protein
MFSHRLPLLGRRSAVDIFSSSRVAGELYPETAAQPPDPAGRSTAGSRPVFSRPLIENVGPSLPLGIETHVSAEIQVGLEEY